MVITAPIMSAILSVRRSGGIAIRSPSASHVNRPAFEVKQVTPDLLHYPQDVSEPANQAHPTAHMSAKLPRYLYITSFLICSRPLGRSQDMVLGV